MLAIIVYYIDRVTFQISTVPPIKPQYIPFKLLINHGQSYDTTIDKIDVSHDKCVDDSVNYELTTNGISRTRMGSIVSFTEILPIPYPVVTIGRIDNTAIFLLTDGSLYYTDGYESAPKRIHGLSNVKMLDASGNGFVIL